MKDTFEQRPQESIDNPPSPFVETIQHFDYTDPKQMKVAQKYRVLEFPFRVYNIAEIDDATAKLTYHFDRHSPSVRKKYAPAEEEKSYVPQFWQSSIFHR